jgi:hypothetical protein
MFVLVFPAMWLALAISGDQPNPEVGVDALDVASNELNVILPVAAILWLLVVLWGVPRLMRPRA